jgi:hypothetical protein
LHGSSYEFQAVPARAEVPVLGASGTGGFVVEVDSNSCRGGWRRGVRGTQS